MDAKVFVVLALVLTALARLKNNNRQVCIDPKLKWIQEYLDKALNKGSREEKVGKKEKIGKKKRQKKRKAAQKRKN
ncbi:CXCL12 [Cervus elaphus hippelaphus]|uniref:CXCL12 n=1 Tax=Cervus elaphus hippelaphus TaxID=46360 RepID=A0A212CP12_CEREH|nr:CXCL12 [Cervus elaphus hippelaphus]